MAVIDEIMLRYNRPLTISSTQRVHVEVTSNCTAEGYSVIETGLVLWNSASGQPALELTLENVGGDIKTGNRAQTYYSANIADNGPGVWFRGYTKVSNGTDTVTKYLDTIERVALDDVRPKGIIKKLTPKGSTAVWRSRMIGMIYGDNTAEVENSKIIPIYSNSRNLYNDSTTTDGYRIYWATGVPYEDANAATSDYISVQTNVTYIASSSSVYIIGYDISHTYLGVWNGSTFIKNSQNARQSITVPAGCAYIKIMVVNKSILHTNFMFNSGSTALPYEPYYKPLVAYSFEGQCLQASAPTPNSPVAVQEFGDLIPNLCTSVTKGNQNAYFYTTNISQYISADDKKISVYAEINLANTSVSVYLSTSFGEVWKRSSNIVNGKLETVVTLSDTDIDNILNSTSTVAIRLYKSDTSFTSTTNVMMVIGSQVIPYGTGTNYKISVTSARQTRNIILSEPLRKIGDYADSVDSEGVVTRRIGKYSITDGLSLSSYTASVSGIGASIDMPSMLNNARLLGMCSHFEPQVTPSSSDLDGVTFGAANIRIYFTFSTATATALNLTDITSTRAWFDSQNTNGTPVTIYYVLATPTISHGYNLFDKNKATLQAYINSSTGEIVASSSTTPYFATDYISIESNKEYWWTDSKRTNAGAFYDAAKQYISGWNTSTSSSTTLQSFVAPNNAAYCRLSGSLPSIDTYMLNEGSTALPYEPYEYISLPSTIPTSSGLSNIIIGTSLTPSKFTYDLGKMFMPHMGRIRIDNTESVYGTTTIRIYSNGSNLTDYSFEGQCSQASTPTPSSPVEIKEFGDYISQAAIDNILTNTTITIAEPTPTLSTSGAGRVTVVGTRGVAAHSGLTIEESGFVYVKDTSVTTALILENVGKDGITKNLAGTSNGSKTINFVDTTGTGTRVVAYAIVTDGTYTITIYTEEARATYQELKDEQDQGITVSHLYTGPDNVTHVGKYQIPITSNDTKQFIYLADPLRKIGDYADTIDSDGDVTRKIKKLILDGTETIGWYNNFFYIKVPNDNAYLNSDNVYPVYATHYAQMATMSDDNSVRMRLTSLSTLGTGERPAIQIKQSSITQSPQSMGDYLATQYTNGTPVTVYYVLATPTIEYLPPYNNLFDYKTAYSTYINANGEIEGNAYSVSTIINYFTADQIGKSITITAFAKTVLSTRVAIQTRINGVDKESNSVTQDNSGLLKITVTPTSTSDYFCLTYGSGSYNNIYSWVGFNEGTNYIPVPTIPTSSGFSNITIGTSLAPSKFTYDLGKMFVPKW